MTAALTRRRLLAAALAGLAAAAVNAREPLRWSDVKARIRRRYPRVQQLAVPALHDWLQDPARPRPLLLDAREADEFNDSHLPHAVHAPTLADAMRALDRHPQATRVVVYCSVGERSSALADRLIERLASRTHRLTGGQRAAPEVFNLEGSIFEWANAGLPLVGRDGGVTPRVHPFDARWGELLDRQRWSRAP